MLKKYENFKDVVKFIESLLPSALFNIYSYNNYDCCIYIGYKSNGKTIYLNFDDDKFNILTYQEDFYTDMFFNTLDDVNKMKNDLNNIMNCIQILVENKKNIYDLAVENGIFEY